MALNIAALITVVLILVAKTDASVVPPWVRAKRMAISPGNNFDPEIIAATVSSIRYFASNKVSGGSSWLRAPAI